MAIPKIESVDHLKAVLDGGSLHVLSIAGREGYFVSPKGDPWGIRGRVAESLVEEAVAQGVLVESGDACSCFDLAASK